MSLFAISLISVLAIGLLVLALAKSSKKNKTLEKNLLAQKKNTDYIVYLLRDLEDIAGFGNDLSYVIDTIAKSLESTFPHSAISSIFKGEKKIIFKSISKEPVNTAFIYKVKDSMTEKLDLPQEKKPEFEESVTGVPLDDLNTSEIKSSADIVMTVNFRTIAVINISSTLPNLYSDEDKKTLETMSYLISGFLSRIDVLLKFEKSKSLAMIDSFSDGIFMVDVQNELIAMNDAAIKFLNITETRPVLNDALSALPNSYNFKDKIERSMQENHQIIENEIAIKGKIFKIIVTPVHEIQESIANQPPREPITIGASVLLHDITLEKSLTQMRDDFTNIMVHELRSPLTAIKASSEFLISKADLTEDEKKKLIQMTSDSSKKMLDKIALILDAAKMESGLFTIRKTESDLKKLLSDRIASFTPVAVQKSITFRANIDPGIPVFSFDAIRIDEVINNLLSNSLKFTPEHGTITLNATLSDDRIIVAVSDTGEGISKDKQGKLFTKYTQAPSESEHVGTGLGLFVVKQIVEDHGGTVSLSSDLGRGTTITFTLPLHPLTILPKIATERAGVSQKMVN
jgi:two-component system, OmpR family, sensor histidine kinase VicK